jgi:hypothetical protein
LRLSLTIREFVSNLNPLARQQMITFVAQVSQPLKQGAKTILSAKNPQPQPGCIDLQEVLFTTLMNTGQTRYPESPKRYRPGTKPGMGRAIAPLTYARSM